MKNEYLTIYFKKYAWMYSPTKLNINNFVINSNVKNFFGANLNTIALKQQI